jgi:hypothetical protein
MAFQGFLKQSTAIDILLGPFVDDTDGVSPEAGLTIAAADVLLSKAGQTLALKSDVTACAADGSEGDYNCELDATDTNTVGQLTIRCSPTGALPVRLDYHVVEEAVYDAMYGGSAAGPLQSTTAARTLDVTATGAAGIDWGNVENPSTAVDLSSTDIQLCDTITTYTGNTVQTADHTAGIADIPTVAEFNARTLVAASYFDPAADAVANVTLVATTTTNTDMRGTDSAALASVCTEARLAELDAANLPADIDNILLDTAEIGAAGAGLTSIFTTQMTESYSADGAAPTPAQSLFLIQQSLTEVAISSTTETIKKLDGSTAAATLTLDSASAPTSKTRAT